jgi:hypothetical protein
LDDEQMNCDESISDLNERKNLTLVFGESKTKIEAINRDMDKAPDYDILLLTSDDMVPKVFGYDEIIRESMRSEFPDTDGTIWFSDGYNERINTLPILGRKYYERFGYIYHPDYLSEWADDEFTTVAHILNKMVYYPLTIIRHEHPYNGHGERDKVHEDNIRNSPIDERLYHRRKSINFGITQ